MKRTCFVNSLTWFRVWNLNIVRESPPWLRYDTGVCWLSCTCMHMNVILCHTVCLGRVFVLTSTRLRIHAQHMQCKIVKGRNVHATTTARLNWQIFEWSLVWSAISLKERKGTFCFGWAVSTDRYTPISSLDPDVGCLIVCECAHLTATPNWQIRE